MDDSTKELRLKLLLGVGALFLGALCIGEYIGLATGKDTDG